MGETSESFERVDLSQEISNREAARARAPITPQSFGVTPSLENQAAFERIEQKPPTWRQTARICVNRCAWPSNPELRGIEHGCQLGQGVKGIRREISGSVVACKVLEEYQKCDALLKLHPELGKAAL